MDITTAIQLPPRPPTRRLISDSLRGGNSIKIDALKNLVFHLFLLFGFTKIGTYTLEEQALRSLDSSVT